MKKGSFIVFEGIDGSGKSTQVALLQEKMKKEGVNCHFTMEPTQGPVGAMIRNILTGRVLADPRVIAGLFAADRMDHLVNQTNGLIKMVEQGIHVVCDRYYFSSYAYHAVDLPMEQVIAMNESCASLLRPTVTIFIDVDPEITMERIQKNRGHVELFEKLDRLKATRNYYQLAFEQEKEKENVVVIDGNRPIEAVFKDVWNVVKPLL